MYKKVIISLICLLFIACLAVSCTPKEDPVEGDYIRMSPVLNNGKVVVTVSLEQNFGVTAMTLTLDYDTDVLTLTNVEKGTALSSLRYTETGHTGDLGYAITPFKFVYTSDLTKNDTSTGKLFTLYFSVNRTSDVKKTTVDLKYDTATGVSYRDETGSLAYKQITIKPATISLG